MLSGKLPPPVAELLTASRLIALAKPGGGARPIAIGECLTQLTANAALTIMGKAARECFLPLQYGVAVPAAAHPGVLCLAYADDVTFLGDSDVAVAAFTHFIDKLVLLGLTHNPGKCAAWCIDDTCAPMLPPRVTFNTDGVRLLGNYLGPPASTVKFLADQLDGMAKLLPLLERTDPQVASLLLTRCISRRVAYLTCTTPLNLLARDKCLLTAFLQPACSPPLRCPTSARPACCATMASLRVLAFDHEGRPLQFDTWLDDLQLYLLSDSRDSVPLFDHTSGAAPAPPAIADSATRSQWLTRDAAARLAIRNHLPLAECAHFGQHRTAQTLYDAVVARYSSPATAALGGLLLPYLFPELSTFATVEDLVSHLRTSNARYRAAAPTEFLDRNQPPMFTTLYFIVTRLPDSLRFVRDHFLSLDPTSLTVDLLEQHLLAAETSAVATSLVLRMSGLLLPVRSAAAARARVAGVVEGAAGVVVGAAVEAVEVVAAVGVVEGVGTLVVAVEAAVGVAVVAAVAVVGVGLELSVEILEEASGSGNSVGARPLRPCSFRPYWAELLRSGVAIFDLDYDAILSAMYALSTSAEGDCYRFLLCMLCLRQLCEWLVRRARLRSGAPGAGAAGAGGAGVTAGAGSNGGTAIAGPGGARTRGTGAAGTGGVRGAGAGDPTEPGVAGAGSSGAGGVGAGGAGGGGTDAGAAGAGGIGAGGARAGGAVAVDTGGTMRPRPYFVPLLQQSQLPLQPASPLPAPSPYTAQSGGLIEHCEPASHPASLVRTARRVPRSRPPPVPGTHTMTLRPSSVLLRVPLPAPPESSLPQVPDPKSDRARAASPTVSRLLATAVTDPSFESGAASALVGELLDFAAACPLDYATALVAESEFASPTSVGGECALGTVVLEDRQEDFECLAAAVPRFASMLLAHEGDPDAPDIPTPRSYVEASTGPYSSQWQAAMDAEMASWKSTGTYIDEGVDYFQTFSRTLKMTTLQRDYELHSLDFSTAFLQGSLHEEIWLRRPPGFTGPFSAGTQWSLRRLVYGLRQAPCEWHDTLKTTLAALGFAPSTADPSLFLRTDTSLPPF
ncbi:unnamed protein product [Closterium sp. NIES-53]